MNTVSGLLLLLRRCHPRLLIRCRAAASLAPAAAAAAAPQAEGGRVHQLLRLMHLRLLLLLLRLLSWTQRRRWQCTAAASSRQYVQQPQQ